MNNSLPDILTHTTYSQPWLGYQLCSMVLNWDSNQNRPWRNKRRETQKGTEKKKKMLKFQSPFWCTFSANSHQCRVSPLHNRDDVWNWTFTSYGKLFWAHYADLEPSSCSFDNRKCLETLSYIPQRKKITFSEKLSLALKKKKRT